MKSPSSSRRRFLKQAAAATGAFLLPAVFDTSKAWAAFPVPDPVTLILFLRGGADPLSIFPPLQAKATAAEWSSFVALRPNTRIVSPVPLNSTLKFGLHPSLTAVQSLWTNQQAALVLGAGSLNVTRSHFEQMSYIEGGDPTSLSSSGYLNRALAAVNPTSYVLQGLALQPAFDPSIPLSLRGPRDVQAVESIEDMAQLSTPGMTSRIDLASRIDGMFGSGAAGCASLTSSIQRDLCIKAGASLNALSEARAMVAHLAASGQAISDANLYSPDFMQPALSGSLATAMREAARCIYSQPRVRFLTVDFAGFDTHQSQGVGPTARGGLDWRLAELNQALTRFIADATRLGFWPRTTIVIMSEFGRTIRENATAGTDHGRGGMAMVLGPTAVLGTSKFLVPATLDLQRLADPTRSMTTRDEINDPYNALPVAYDLRQILGELLLKRYGLSSAQLEAVFPDFSAGYRPLGLLV
jgi:uncharacterized protein (DUF1501 family)